MHAFSCIHALVNKGRSRTFWLGWDTELGWGVQSNVRHHARNQKLYMEFYNIYDCSITCSLCQIIWWRPSHRRKWLYCAYFMNRYNLRLFGKWDCINVFQSELEVICIIANYAYVFILLLLILFAAVQGVLQNPMSSSYLWLVNEHHVRGHTYLNKSDLNQTFVIDCDTKPVTVESFLCYRTREHLTHD